MHCIALDPGLFFARNFCVLSRRFYVNTTRSKYTASSGFYEEHVRTDVAWYHLMMGIVLLYTLVSVLVISAASLIGVVTLSVKTSVLKAGMHFFIGLAAGALLGDAFIHLIPTAFSEGVDGITFALAILGGMVIFLLLEKYLRWYNKNVEHGRCLPGEVCIVQSKKPVGALVLFGDGVHNFIDGAIIAASYAVSIPLGVATTVAVFLHEVPQEISDFALLLHSGYSKIQALLWNGVSALTALVGAVLFFALGDVFVNIEPIAAIFTAGGFIYIAAANLVPEIQKTEHPGTSAVEFIAVIIGIALMFALLALE